MSEHHAEANHHSVWAATVIASDASPLVTLKEVLGHSQQAPNDFYPAVRSIGVEATDDFIELAALGAGGMGTAHTARQQSLGRTVAIKTLHQQHVGNQDIEAAFLVEAAVLAELEHPNIVPVIESGRTAEGALFML